jgi:signal transduction histidine kinase
MLALTAYSSSSSLRMLLGQDLIHLSRNCSEIEQLLPQMAAMIGRALGVEVCLLVVGRNEQNPLQSVLWTEGKTTLLSTTARFWHQPWVERTKFSSVSVLSHPLATGSRKWKLTQEITLVSGLSLRTEFQGSMNGMIILGSSKARYWSEEEQDLKEIQDALAIAYYIIQTQMTIPTRSLGSEESPLFRVWIEATRQQLEQQRQWNQQLIHNIVTIMSDQTRNPLATIRMGIEMLRKRPPSPEVLTQRLDMMEQQWRKLNDINEKILQLRTLKCDQNSLVFQSVNLIAFLESFLTRYQEEGAAIASRRREIKTKWPEETVFVNVDINCLKKILQELITNAEKFALPHTPIQLEIQDHLETDSNKVTVYCRNFSHHIPPKHLKYLFDPFYREQWTIDDAIPGIGLGLTITKTLVEQLNGTIDVICEPTDSPDFCSIVFVLALPKKSLAK